MAVAYLDVFLSIAVGCRTFRDIANAEGSKSVERKKAFIQKLVVASRQNETGYIMRALQVCATHKPELHVH